MKKQIICVCTLSLGFIVGCSQAGSREALEDSITKANEEILNQGNMGYAREIFPSNYVNHGPDGAVIAGPESIVKFVTNLREAFPDLKVEVEIIAVDGDKVAWTRTHNGTHKKEFMGIQASNKPIKWTSVIITRYENGKIAEEWGTDNIVERMLNP